MTVPDPDPRELADPDAPGGLIDGGAAEMPGVQDAGPSEADAEADADADAEDHSDSSPTPDA